jgi:signal transduction histidine kinase/ActR/RegA family two-component response regulator
VVLPWGAMVNGPVSTGAALLGGERPGETDTTPDISTRVVSVFFDSFEEVYGREHAERARARIGGLSREYLTDPGNFVSLGFCERTAVILTEEAGDPDFLRKAGLRQFDRPKLLGFAYYVLRSMGSPRLYYAMASRIGHTFNRVGEITTEQLGPTKARFRYHSKKTERTKLLCVGRIGQLSAPPKLWGLPPATARELCCQCEGAESCVYELEWLPTVRPLLRAFAGAMLGAAAGAISRDPRIVAACALFGGLVALCLAYRRRALLAERQILDSTEGVGRALEEARVRFEAIQKLHADAEAARQSLLAEAARRTDAESALVESQKLEAVGRLSGVIAHDFNNLLTIVMSYADLAKSKLSRAEELGASLDAILLACERAADLTRRLLSFARHKPADPRILTLETHLRGLEGMLGRLVGEDVTVELSLAEPESNVRIDPSQLEQVLLNLTANARDAMPRGGVLRFVTRRVAEAGGQPAVELSVVDTGSGMDAATKARVFEAFFTTKESGKGTGLGLASAHTIVAQARGRIEVESEPGCGSTFRIILPQVEGQVSALPVIASDSIRGGVETVLVVEDDDALRQVTCEALVAVGYRVLTAPGMVAALELAARTPDHIELLVTDVVMRGGDGYELSARLRAVRPELAVLVVSGYPDDVIERHGLTSEEFRLLRKPFTARELEREVRDVLDAARKQSGHRATRRVVSSSTG